MIRKLVLTGIVSVVALAILVSGIILAGGSVPTTDILIGDASGVAGQVGVPVDVVVNTQGQKIRGVNINLAFDGVVLPGAAAVAGPALPANWVFTENLAGPGDHRVVALSLSAEEVAVEGVLYTISFAVAADAPLGSVPVTASLVDIPSGGVINVVPGVINVVGEVVSNGVVTMGLAALIDSLDVTPRTFKGPGGSTQQFTAIANFNDGSVVDVTESATWTSSDEAVATVSATGLGTIVGPGNVVITATINPIP